MKNTRHITGRHWALSPVLVLACALLLAQALGLAHRIVHGPQLSSLQAVSQAATAEVPAASAVVADGFLTQLFAGHQGEADCRVFEQLSHADTLPAVPLLALPALVPLPPVALAVAGRFIRLILPFQARGPPLTR